jgi:hypothetical protein
VAPHDRPDRVLVGGACRLDRQRLGPAGEERLAHDRVVDQVQHVCGVAPQLCGRGLGDLIAELPPGGASVPTVPYWVGAVEEAVDRLTDRLVHHQALAARVDEWQPEQARDGPFNVYPRQHGAEQRLGHSPHDRRRLERAPRLGIPDVLQVQAGELGDDPRGCCFLQRELGMLGCAGGGEHEGQGLAARDAVEPRHVGRSRAVQPEELLRVVVAEGPSGRLRNSPPRSANQLATGGSRPDRTSRPSARSDGTSTRRSQVSMSLNSS